MAETAWLLGEGKNMLIRAVQQAEMAVEAAKEKGFVTEGDRTVIASGIKVATGNTNAIRVYTVK